MQDADVAVPLSRKAVTRISALNLREVREIVKANARIVNVDAIGLPLGDASLYHKINKQVSRIGMYLGSVYTTDRYIPHISIR